MFTTELSNLFAIQHGETRTINAENRTGAKGQGGRSASVLGVARKGSPCLRSIKSGESSILAEMEGPGIINHIWITVTDKTTDYDRYVLRDLILKMYWDDEEEPSVEVPVGDFFCCGFGEPCLVNSLPITVVPKSGMNMYFKMPFQKSAKIVLENQHANTIPEFFYEINYCLYEELPNNSLYFHARWNREAVTRKGIDYTILSDVEGYGHYIGTYMAISTLERYWWGEGEVKFYIDDDEFPTICSTGLEDYFGGSWSFASIANGNMQETLYNTPYVGYPFYSKNDRSVNSPYYNDDCPPMRGLYRWHIQDPIFFEKKIRVTAQQIGSGPGGLFEREDDVSSVAYWYQTEPHVEFKPIIEKEMRWPR